MWWIIVFPKKHHFTLTESGSSTMPTEMTCLLPTWFPSAIRVSITMTGHCCSSTIVQRSFTVVGSGPCVAIYLGKSSCLLSYKSMSVYNAWGCNHIYINQVYILGSSNRCYSPHLMDLISRQEIRTEFVLKFTSTYKSTVNHILSFWWIWLKYEGNIPKYHSRHFK